jgi:hypothetical protein
MEEVFTCMCGAQKAWTIYYGRIGCGVCGREYSREPHDGWVTDPVDFNKRRETLLVKDAQVSEGGAS